MVLLNLGETLEQEQAQVEAQAKEAPSKKINWTPVLVGAGVGVVAGYAGAKLMSGKKETPVAVSEPTGFES